MRTASLRRLPLRALVAVQFFSLSASVCAADAVPGAPGPVVAVLTWLEETLLGNVAIMLAVIAVAIMAMMMRSRRMDWRFGASVIVGCFILFGVAVIVSGMQAATELAD